MHASFLSRIHAFPASAFFCLRHFQESLRGPKLVVLFVIDGAMRSVLCGCDHFSFSMLLGSVLHSEILVRLVIFCDWGTTVVPQVFIEFIIL